MADTKDLNQFGSKEQQEILKAVYVAFDAINFDGAICSMESYKKEIENGSTKR